MSNPTTPEKLSKAEFEKIVSSRHMRVKLAKSSPYWFFHIYFPDYIKARTADFQREIFKNLTDDGIRHLVIVSFRGSAKSTIVTMVYTLWSIISEERKFVIIASQTQPQAQQHLRNIRSEIESNDLFRADFGDLNAESNEWGIAALSITRFKAKIMSASKGQNIRGLRHGAYRPDLVICDDIEDMESVKYQDTRKDTFRWFNAEIMGVGDLNTKYVTVGNLLHEDSLVMRLKEGFKAGTRSGKYTEYPIVKHRRSMWPGMYPDQAAINKRKGDFDRQTWMREFELKIIPDAEQVVTRDMIKTYSHIPDLLRGETEGYYTGVDLAISSKHTADYTAAVSFIGRNIGEEDMVLYILPRPINERMGFNKTLDALIEIDRERPGTEFIIETNGYQDAAAQSLRAKGMKVTGVNSRNDKRSRLSVAGDAIDRGKVLFPESGCEALLAQLVGFGTEKHDDLMDAFTHAVIAIASSDKVAKKPGRVWTSKRKRRGLPRLGQGSIVRTRSQNGHIIEFNDPHGW